MNSKQRFSFKITLTDVEPFIRTIDVIKWFVCMRLPTSLTAEELKTTKKTFGRLNANFKGRPFGTLLMLYARKIEKEDAHYRFYQTEFLTTVTKDLSSTAARNKFDELLLKVLGKLEHQSDVYNNDRMVMALLLTSDLVNSHLVNGEYRRGADIANWLENYLNLALDFYFAQTHAESYWKTLQNSQQKLLDDLQEALAEEMKQPKPKKQTIKPVIGSKDEAYQMGCQQQTGSSLKNKYLLSTLKRKADTDTHTNTVFRETNDDAAPEVKRYRVISTVIGDEQPQLRLQTPRGQVELSGLNYSPVLQQRQEHNQPDGSLTVSDAGTSSGRLERNPVQRSVTTPSQGIIPEECGLSVEDVIFDSMDYMNEPLPDLFADIDEDDIYPDQADG